MLSSGIKATKDDVAPVPKASLVGTWQAVVTREHFNGAKCMQQVLLQVLSLTSVGVLPEASGEGDVYRFQMRLGECSNRDVSSTSWNGDSDRRRSLKAHLRRSAGSMVSWRDLSAGFVCVVVHVCILTILKHTLSLTSSLAEEHRNTQMHAQALSHASEKHIQIHDIKVPGF